jgi:hypothetical protein
MCFQSSDEDIITGSLNISSSITTMNQLSSRLVIFCSKHHAFANNDFLSYCTQNEQNHSDSCKDPITDHTSGPTTSSTDSTSCQMTPFLDFTSLHTSSSIQEDNRASPLTIPMDIDDSTLGHTTLEDDDNMSPLTTLMDLDSGTPCDTPQHVTSSEDDEDDDTSHPTASLPPQCRTSSLVNGNRLSSVRKQFGKTIYQHQYKRKKSRVKHTMLRSGPVFAPAHGSSKLYPIWVDIEGDVSIVFIIASLFKHLFLFQPMLDHDLLDLPVPMVCQVHLLNYFLYLMQSQLSEDKVILSMWHIDASRPKREHVFQAPHTIVS